LLDRQESRLLGTSDPDSTYGFIAASLGAICSTVAMPYP